MFRSRRGGSACDARVPVTHSSVAGRGRLGAVGVLLPGGGTLALAVLAGLTLPGASAHAAFPGTNGKIACHGPGDRTLANPDAEDDFEIFSLNPDGSARTLVTNNGPFNIPGDSTSGRPQETGPAYSPDGTKVAFESTRTGGSELFIQNSDGTGPATRLTFALGDDAAPHFSPDGRQIVFTAGRDGQFEVYRMNADGSAQTRLTTNPGNDGRVSWSPDGARLAFETQRASATDPPEGPFNNEIATMNPDGTGVTVLTDTRSPVGHRSTRWSPDGSQIVFDSNRDEPAPTTESRFGNNDIYKMNRNGSGVTRLTTNAGTAGISGSAIDQLPQFSPDGTKIVFDSGRNRETVPAGGRQLNPSEVYTMNATDGSGQTRITNARGTDSRCDWQPIPRVAVAPPVYDIPRPPGGGPGGSRPPGTPRGTRVRPNMVRPSVSARQRGNRIIVRVRGRLVGVQGRSCVGRVKVG